MKVGTFHCLRCKFSHVDLRVVLIQICLRCDMRVEMPTLVQSDCSIDAEVQLLELPLIANHRLG